MFIFVFILLLQPLLVNATNCSHIEIPGFDSRVWNSNTKKLEVGSSYIKTFDQVGINSCFAYSAAALADSFAYRVLKERDGFVTDPIEPAMHNSISRSRLVKTLSPFITGCGAGQGMWFEGGFVCEAFKNITNLGRCPYSSSSELRKTETLNVMRGIQKNFFEHSHSNGESPWMCTLKSSKGMPFTTFMTEYIFAETARSLLGHKCDKDGRRELSNVGCISKGLDNLKAQEKIEVIDKILKSNRSVSIGYCSKFLLKGKDLDTTNFFQGCEEGKEDMCGGHASLVVGRKLDPITKQCMYKLRNSWGKDVCNKYHSSLNPIERCDINGDLWVDQEILMKHSKYIEYLNR